jgi:uncharacterized protein (TIGR02118 family)
MANADRREFIMAALALGATGCTFVGAQAAQNTTEKTMFKLTILYPNTPDGRFDFDYYIKTHMPLSLKRQGQAVKSVLVEKGYDGAMDGVEFAYIAICHFTYESQDAFTNAFLPHAEELQGDIANYTDIKPIIQFSTVELEQG